MLEDDIHHQQKFGKFIKEPIPQQTLRKYFPLKRFRMPKRYIGGCNFKHQCRILIRQKAILNKQIHLKLGKVIWYQGEFNRINGSMELNRSNG